jgi:hypothetical protein
MHSYPHCSSYLLVVIMAQHQLRMYVHTASLAVCFVPLLIAHRRFQMLTGPENVTMPLNMPTLFSKLCVNNVRDEIVVIRCRHLRGNGRIVSGQIA